MTSLENRLGSHLGEQITRDYNLTRLLGKGGMGEVYLAEQLHVGRRRVALKVLNRACSEDPEIVKRFENEAASAGRIHHRNVVMIYESRRTGDDHLYVAMEYVEGRTLRDEINARGALPLGEVLDITRQVCAGLYAAHKLDIVHRDIKPDNIMLSDDDGERIVKVLDFGIARLSEPGTGGSATKSGVVMGTPYYMSPEQALGSTGEKIDARSDLYSLAMVVYQMLTGRVAFESDSWMRVMYQHVHDAPLPPSELRVELKNFVEFERAVLKALEKERDNRQATVMEFVAELTAAYQRALAANPEQAATAVYGATQVTGNPPLGSDSATVMAGASAPTPLPKPPAPVTQVEQATPTAVAAPPAAQKFWTAKKALALGAVALALAVAVYLYVARTRSIAETSNQPTSTAKPLPSMETYEFDAMLVDKQGNVTSHRRMKAKYFSEDIGNGVGLEMLDIPAGKFLMGARVDVLGEDAAHERPQHEVNVPRFFIGKYEITQAQWAAVAKLPRVTRDLDPNPSTFTGDTKLPVQNVSWWDAVEFCERLSRATGRHYRLPTEAEWEYACRAGTTTPFYFGETINADLVNYDANYPYGGGPKGVTRKRPNPVGNLSSPNAFGVNNSHGNMDEWCLDPWHENYVGAPTDGSAWGVNGDTSFRVARGGSWYDGGDNCRSAARDKNAPDLKLPFLGFRVAMVAP